MDEYSHNWINAPSSRNYFGLVYWLYVGDDWLFIVRSGGPSAAEHNAIIGLLHKLLHTPGLRVQ